MVVAGVRGQVHRSDPPQQRDGGLQCVTVRPVEQDVGARLERAAQAALAEAPNRTRDLGGPASLDQLTAAVIDQLA